MKTIIHSLLITLALLSALNLQVTTARAQGTAFTYQGHLNNGNAPANGSYDLTFSLFSGNSGGSVLAGPLTTNAVAISNGLFTVTLDFGNQFPGANRWLEIGVRTNGGGAFSTLAPRQELTPTPYAMLANTANILASSAQLSIPGLTIQANGAGAPNMIGGSSDNFVSSGVVGATIAGGGAINTADIFPPSATNSVTEDFGTVSGGAVNTASGGFATVGGGLRNTASGFAATVPGGQLNTANGFESFAAGYAAEALHDGAFVWADTQGSFFSSTAANQFLIRAGGGVGINMNNPNGASLYVQGSRSGGTFNSSVGFFENTSTAMGLAGSGPALRVVCDGGSAPAGALSVSDNGTGPIAEFGNGLQFVAFIQNDGTITNLGDIATAGNVFAHGVMLTSDRNAKENFAALDAQTILRKVAALPLTEWNYKTDRKGVQHIGPMAQDFHSAFDLNGADDKHISVVDEGGVALAAIQGLNQKVEEKDAEIQDLQQSVAELKAMVKQLAARK